MPLATSETVPSPPHAMMSRAPLRAASLASAAASPRCFVNRTRNEPKCERRSLAICGHSSPVLPPADDGLTITTDIDLFRSAYRSHCFVFFTKLSNFCHNCVSDLFVRSQSIGFGEMFAQIQYLAEMDANHVFAVPVSRHLLWQTVTQPRNEHRYHLWLRFHDQLSHTRLRAQKRIRIVALIACSLRMKTDDVACP